VERVRRNQFRHAASIAKLSNRTIGYDFLYLRDWGRNNLHIRRAEALPFFYLWLGQLSRSRGPDANLACSGISERSQTSPLPWRIGLARILPVIVFSLIAARWRLVQCRNVMFVTQTGAALGGDDARPSDYLGKIDLWHIYALTALQVAVAFDGPARQAIIRTWCGQDLPNASA